jgi:hypothetical protein
MSRLKGNIPFTVQWVDGSEDFVFLLDFNALCLLEEELPGIMSGDVDLNSPKVARLVVWAALQRNHPQNDQEGVDIQKAGDIITAYGMDATLELLNKAFGAAFPQGGSEGAENPPKASTSRKR